jgi:hypothetical protein
MRLTQFNLKKSRKFKKSRKLKKPNRFGNSIPTPPVIPWGWGRTVHRVIINGRPLRITFNRFERYWRYRLEHIYTQRQRQDPLIMTRAIAEYLQSSLRNIENTPYFMQGVNMLENGVTQQQIDAGNPARNGGVFPTGFFALGIEQPIIGLNQRIQDIIRNQNNIIPTMTEVFRVGYNFNIPIHVSRNIAQMLIDLPGDNHNFPFNVTRTSSFPFTKSALILLAISAILTAITYYSIKRKKKATLKQIQNKSAEVVKKETGLDITECKQLIESIDGKQVLSKLVKQNKKLNIIQRIFKKITFN